MFHVTNFLENNSSLLDTLSHSFGREIPRPFKAFLVYSTQTSKKMDV